MLAFHFFTRPIAESLKPRSNKTKLLALSASLLLALSACRGKPEEDETKKVDAPIPVEASAVALENMSATFQGTATLEAEAVAQVVSKASGVVLRIVVEEGQNVGKGQLLASLENERQRLQLAQAAASLRKIENDFKRQSELFTRKLIGSDVFERSRLDLENQRSTYELQALELSYTEIRAPITGVVSQRLVKIGNQINIGQALFRIDDFDPLEARVAVPERDMRSIQAGQPVQMLVDAIPGQVFEGMVGRVSPVVDPKTGTFDVIAQFREQSGSLRSGMFGRINIVTAVHPNAMVVPRVALLSEDGQASVYVVNANKVERRSVEIGLNGNGKTEILSGLKAGEQVITLGQNAVREGSLVRILAPAGVAAKPVVSAGTPIAIEQPVPSAAMAVPTPSAPSASSVAATAESN
jgi:membrane fusion protein, multidrug efflux system